VVEEVKSAVAVLRKPWSWETHRKLSKFERRRMDEARFRHVETGFTFGAKPNRKLSSGGQLPPDLDRELVTLNQRRKFS